MKTPDIIYRAGRSLAQAKARTILTSLAIAVGATTISLALAAGAGGREYTNEMVRTSGDARALNVYQMSEAPAESKELPEYGVESKSYDQQYITSNNISELRSAEGVETVTPVYNINTLYASRGEGHTKRVAPVTVRADKTEMKLAAGALTDGMIPEHGMTISETLLSSFGFLNAEEAVGKTIVLRIPAMTSQGVPLESEGYDETFTIVAVDKSTGTTLYYEPALRIAPVDAERIHAYQTKEQGVQRYIGAIIRVAEDADVVTTQRLIKDKGYEVYSVEDTREAMLQVIAVAQWGLVGFGALAILASIFGIINTQYISVLERTQQIGLMKALGMRSKDIGRLFRYEAAWVGLLGGVIGIGIAWAASFANPLISNVLELDEGVRLILVEPLTCLVIVLALMIIAVASGYFPSRKASRLDPIEALRTE